jgi:beta-fructofuranosidase
MPSVPIVQGSEGHRTLYPSQIQDIRAVFDGTIIPKGHLGFPTIIYTSVTFGALGAVAGEQEGTESQSLAWTEDGGESWKKLGWGPEKGGNPVIWTWPEQNLSGSCLGIAFCL